MGALQFPWVPPAMSVACVKEGCSRQGMPIPITLNVTPVNGNGLPESKQDLPRLRREGASPAEQRLPRLGLRVLEALSWVLVGTIISGRST